MDRKSLKSLNPSQLVQPVLNPNQLVQLVLDPNLCLHLKSKILMKNKWSLLNLKHQLNHNRKSLSSDGPRKIELVSDHLQARDQCLALQVVIRFKD